MSRKTAKKALFDRVLAAIGRRTAPEARELRREMLRLGRPGSKVSWDKAMEVASRVILAGDRTLARRESDKLTDHHRRVLVGIRVPVDVAGVYWGQAEALGWTHYRWVSEALTRGYRALCGEEVRQAGYDPAEIPDGEKGADLTAPAPPT